jgi:hypothetical protein
MKEIDNMRRLSLGVLGKSCFLVLLMTTLTATYLAAQLETGTVSGQILDPSGANIVGAQVKLIDIDRGTSTASTTNNSGLYTFPSVRPGRYRMEVAATGFKVVNATGLTLNVQDHLEQNFKLTVGSVSESVTVEGGASQVNTESAAVSTVVDRQFAENMPLNGRSFQSLIELAPGVVPAVSNFKDGGQFNVNGQRASANYWTVDGVSSNIGISPFPSPGNGLGGSLGSFSASGGTNSLVSIDALQEFRIQTSTYAPEFGRTPGGQISIVTRSGTNRFHGSLFDYFRNDALDATDWFNGLTHSPKAAERQNDFGGTFSGPLLKNRTFFFFSYEGLRLRLPRVQQTTVPCDVSCKASGDVRAQAVPTMQPFLSAYPLPNGPEVFVPCDPSTDPTCPPSGQQPTGSAQFNASYSNPSTLDAYSIRVDHKFNDKFFLFGRYNISPSQFEQRGGNGGQALSVLFSSKIQTETETIGASFVPSAAVTNDLRFNYSRTEAKGTFALDHFGGAVPLVSVPLPSPYNAQNAQLELFLPLIGSEIFVGKSAQNIQRQFNIVDNVTFQKGSHAFKFGLDYRRLSPIFSPPLYKQNPFFGSVSSAAAGNVDIGVLVASATPATFLFRNLGVFAEDTWRIFPRLTMTYGVRWDIDFVPSSLSGAKLAAVTGFDLNDVSKLALAPAGTPLFKTRYGNLAPRLGVAYQVSQVADWGTTVRGGFGIFYDLATQEIGNDFSPGTYPFGSLKICPPFFGQPPTPSCPASVTFPLDPPVATPDPVSAESLTAGGVLGAFDPHLELPYSLQWNVALEQALGKQQTISMSYIGSAGRRLIQTAEALGANSNLPDVLLVTNAATSDYNALQLQFQRHLSRGLQALVSYTWAHSIDTASAGSTFVGSNQLLPSNVKANRGPSDFDIRSGFSAGITYEVPAFGSYKLLDRVVRGWSLQSIVHAQSASAVDVHDPGLAMSKIFNAQVRPDVVPGIPLYLYGSQYPGGKAFNGTPGAVAGGCPDGSPSIGPFCPPPVGPDGLPTRQGNLGRNALRGFGIAQWDFAVHRDFALRESVKLQFRAEMFNVLNHPNFGPPSGCLRFCGDPFGVATKTLAQTLGANVGNGGFDPLYQLGGPRSIQLGLKLTF